MRTRIRTLVLAAIAVLVLIQLVPIQRSNPPVTGDIPAPNDVKVALRRACYNCHSHETEWPWYSRVAPVSWLIAHDVSDGREHLNFSTWDQVASREKIERWKETWRQLQEGDMAPWYYLPVHGEATLTDTEMRRIRIWALGSANEEAYEAGSAPAAP
jgi:hypothetical protein